MANGMCLAAGISCKTLTHEGVEGLKSVNGEGKKEKKNKQIQQYYRLDCIHLHPDTQALRMGEYSGMGVFMDRGLQVKI